MLDNFCKFVFLKLTFIRTSSGILTERQTVFKGYQQKTKLFTSNTVYIYVFHLVCQAQTLVPDVYIRVSARDSGTHISEQQRLWFPCSHTRSMDVDVGLTNI